MSDSHDRYGRQAYQHPSPPGRPVYGRSDDEPTRQHPQQYGYAAPTYHQTPYGAVASTDERAPDPPRPVAATTAGIITIVAGALYVLGGIGLIAGAGYIVSWLTRRVVDELALSIANGLGSVSQYRTDLLFWSGSVGLVLSILILVLMWLPATNAWFRRRDAVPPPTYPPYRG